MDFAVNIVDTHDPITKGMSSFVVSDELYHLSGHDPKRSQLLMSAFDPVERRTFVMAYKHTYGKGRVVYYANGHEMGTFRNPMFIEFIYRSLLWLKPS